MALRRVVVTGVGAVSALGPDAPSFFNAVSTGRSGIRPLECTVVEPLRFCNGAEVSGYCPDRHFDPRQLSYVDRFAQLAIVAGREAVRDAGLSIRPERTAVITGTGGGGQSTTDTGFYDLYSQRLPRVNPLNILRVMPSSGASQLSMELGVTGPVYTVSTACSSSNHAIGQAFWSIRSGLVDAAITGGSECVFSYGFLKAWEAMRVVSPDTCRPFSKDRRGLILGEGGAMLVLEERESATARGARIYGEIVGFGMSSDAHHITQPSPSGAAAAMRMALADAGAPPEAVEYINAHGTGTTANDSVETEAIHRLFGRHAGGLAVSSTKSMHGHALGAAGALEAIATVFALHQGILPPTVNYTEPDPACDLDVVPNEPRARRVEYALSNSFAFGGLNAVLAFRAVG